MADISQITIPINGVNTTFNFKDTVARNPTSISDNFGADVQTASGFVTVDAVNGVQIATQSFIDLSADDGISLYSDNGDITCINGAIVDSNGDTITLPAGGSTDQVLAKNSASDFDVGWATPSGALAPTSRTIATAWTLIPTSTSAYSAVNTTGWNYEVYDDGTVHGWGKVEITGVSMSTFANLRRSNSSYYIPYPVELSEVTFMRFGPAGLNSQFGSDILVDLASGVGSTNFDSKCAQIRPVQFGYYNSTASSQTFRQFVEFWGKKK